MILLSFDIEEFDLPFEYGLSLSWEEQIRISSEGCRKILDCLARNQAKATFFCTARLAENNPELIRDICAEGHEIASHGYAHSTFEEDDLKRSKAILEKLTGQPVKGFRMPRMAEVSDTVLAQAGYTYNSSLNPTFLPGRYNHWRKPRTWFYQNGLLQLPASTTPHLRFPLFWLSFHHLPPALYRRLALRTYRHDGYLLTYFHPWEFMPLQQIKGLPYTVTHNTGETAGKRLEKLILFFKKRNASCITFSQFIDTIPEKQLSDP